MKIENAKDLKEVIKDLEWKKDIKKDKLRSNIKELKENFQPATLLKKLYENTLNSNEWRGKILGASLGLGTGAVANRIIAGKNSTIIKKVVGRLIQAGLTATIVKNIDKVKAVGTAIFKNIFKKKQVDDKKQLEELNTINKLNTMS